MKSYYSLKSCTESSCCCFTVEGLLSAKKQDSLTNKLLLFQSIIMHAYLWHSNQIWGFFTFLAGLAHCAATVKVTLLLLCLQFAIQMAEMT